MTKLFANSGDPDQTPHLCLPIIPLRVSRLKWVIVLPALKKFRARGVVRGVGGGGGAYCFCFVHAFVCLSVHFW